MKKAAIFEKTYQDYLARVAKLDLADLAPRLGFENQGASARVPFFDQVFDLTTDGIVDRNGRRPDLSVCVVLCQYLLMAPAAPPVVGPLMTYKDFKDAAPLVHFFSQAVDLVIARRFSGRSEALAAACRRLDGRVWTQNLGYDVKFRLSALPRVPVILLFNDAEPGFAAQTTLLFEQRAQYHLDMECLAMVGGYLARRLVAADVQ